MSNLNKWSARKISQLSDMRIAENAGLRPDPAILSHISKPHAVSELFWAVQSDYPRQGEIVAKLAWQRPFAEGRC
jgi:hypothetical protein